MRSYSIPEQKQIKVQNALIKAICNDLVDLKLKCYVNGLDVNTIEEIIKKININYKI